MVEELVIEPVKANLEARTDQVNVGDIVVPLLLLWLLWFPRLGLALFQTCVGQEIVG